jgi:Asp-tRNA(Asn)/Glu-tRNA(Gln) amidotransferase B subunit
MTQQFTSRRPGQRHRPAQLLLRVRDGTISGKIAKDVFAAMWAGEGDATRSSLRAACARYPTPARSSPCRRSHRRIPKQLADYRNGNDKLLQFFVGQAMKRLKGQANPQQLNGVLREKLGQGLGTRVGPAGSSLRLLICDNSDGINDGVVAARSWF